MTDRGRGGVRLRGSRGKGREGGRVGVRWGCDGSAKRRRRGRFFGSRSRQRSGGREGEKEGACRSVDSWAGGLDGRVEDASR